MTSYVIFVSSRTSNVLNGAPHFSGFRPTQRFYIWKTRILAHISLSSVMPDIRLTEALRLWLKCPLACMCVFSVWYVYMCYYNMHIGIYTCVACFTSMYMINGKTSIKSAE